ncbi:MAG: hypothetical protein NXI31_19105 [bacterium]|nr:hypothetical protein [bacterium]
MRRVPHFALLGAISAFAIVAPAQNDALPLPTPHTSRITITDPLPWLEALLGNDDLQLLVRGGSVGDLLKVWGGIEIDSVDPARALRALPLASPWLPTAIEVGFPARSTRLPPLLAEFVQLVTLQGATFELDDETAATAARKTLRPEFLRTIEAVSDCPFSLRLRFRTARGADDALELCEGVFLGIKEQSGLGSIDHRGDGMRFTIAPANEWTRVEFAELLDQTDLIADVEDPAVDDYWRWASSHALRIEVDVADTELRVVLGDDQRGIRSTSFPALPEPDGGNTLLEYRVDYTPMQAVAERMLARTQRWQPTAIGKIASLTDTERLLDDVTRTALAIQAAPRATNARLSWSATGLQWLAVSTGEPGVDLRGQPLLELMPDNVAWYAFDGRSTPDATVLGWMQRIEQLLGFQASRDSATAERAEQSLDSWFERLGPLRDLIVHQAPTHWQPPSAWFVTCGPRDASNSRIGSVAPDLLVATTCRGQNGGLPFVRELLTTLLPDRDPSDFDADLGLGIPTVSLPLPRELASGSTPQPHAFAIDDVLVFSTSVRASKDLLASRDVRRDLDVPKAGALVAASATTGRRLAIVMARLGEVVARVLAEVSGAREPWSPATERIALATSAIAGSLELLGNVRSTTTRRGRSTTTRTEVRFASAAPADVAPVLAAARRAAGDWPQNVAVLVARGRCRTGRSVGTFELATSRSGCRNRITGASPQTNVVDEAGGWTHQFGTIHQDIHPFEGDMIRAFNGAATASWSRATHWRSVRLHPDRLPFEAPIVLCRGPASGREFGFEVDIATGQTKKLYPLLGPTPAESLPATIEDYRAALGRNLPHTIRLPPGLPWSAFEIENWTTAKTLPDLRRPQPAAANLDGAPKVPVTRARWGEPMVKLDSPAGTIWAILDLADARLRLSSTGAEILGLDSTVDGPIAIPGLRLGPLDLSGHDFVVSPEVTNTPADAEPPGPNARVGFAALTRVVAEIDFATPSVRLFAPGSAPIDGFEFAPMRYNQGLLYTTVEFGDRGRREFPVMFFAPTPIGFVNHASWTDDFFDGQPIRPGNAGARRAGFVLTAWPEIRIGAARFEDVSCMIPRTRLRSLGAPFPGMLGQGLAKAYLLDIPNGRIGFRR